MPTDSAPVPRYSLPSYWTIARLAWDQFVIRFDVVLWTTLVVGLAFSIAIDLTLPRTSLTQDFASVTELLSILTQPGNVLNIALQLFASWMLIIVDVAVILAMRHTLQRNFPSWTHILKQAWKFYPAALVLTLVINLCSAIGYFFLLIPGVVLATYCSLALVVLVWEQRSIGAALRESARLVHQRFWKVLVYTLCTMILIELVSWLIISVFPSSLGFTTISLLCTYLIQRFGTVFSVVMYTLLSFKPAVKPVTAAVAD